MLKIEKRTQQTIERLTEKTKKKRIFIQMRENDENSFLLFC